MVRNIHSTFIMTCTVIAFSTGSLQAQNVVKYTDGVEYSFANTYGCEAKHRQFDLRKDVSFSGTTMTFRVWVKINEKDGSRFARDRNTYEVDLSKIGKISMRPMDDDKKNCYIIDLHCRESVCVRKHWQTDYINHNQTLWIRDKDGGNIDKRTTARLYVDEYKNSLRLISNLASLIRIYSGRYPLKELRKGK